MNHDYTAEIIAVSAEIRIRIEYDQDAEAPDWNTVGEIAYLKSSHYVLGTEGVSQDRMQEIEEGLRSGELVGHTVYAYVHGGATIRCGKGGYPFDCPWDSGCSGFVYCTKERAIKECLTIEAALKCLESEVDTFDQYLTGQVYGFIIERIDPDAGDNDEGEHLDSCWGFYGLEYCIEEAKANAQFHVEAVAQEKRDIELQYKGM